MYHRGSSQTDRWERFVFKASNLLFSNHLLILAFTGHGKFHFFLLCVCGLGMMGVVVENVNVGFVMPYVRCDMGISTIEQGLLNSAGYVGIVMSSHFWGFLADTSGRQNVLKYALGGSYVCAVLSAFATNIMMLTLMRLLVGMLWVELKQITVTRGHMQFLGKIKLTCFMYLQCGRRTGSYLFVHRRVP